MLVLSRRKEEAILVGNDVKIKIINIRGGRVWLGIDAPRETSVLRAEQLGKKKKEESNNNATQVDD